MLVALHMGTSDFHQAKPSTSDLRDVQSNVPVHRDRLHYFTLYMLKGKCMIYYREYLLTSKRVYNDVKLSPGRICDDILRRASE